MNALLSAADRVQMASSGPVSEKGTSLSEVRNTVTGPLAGAPTWLSFSTGDDIEHVPDLKWKPGGKGLVEVYHRMRGDAQLQGIYMGLTLPIRRYEWFIEPNGAPDRIVQRIATDYNLPIRGQESKPRGRSKRRFAFQQHLRLALLAVIYGHMFFEQVGEIGSDEKWHLRKLGPRMPSSIMEIAQNDDGGLKYIVQKGMGVTDSGRKRTINVDRLLAYVWEMEGANWVGRSLYRGIYKNFLLKDTVLRVGAINIERAGGVPVITGPRGATPEELSTLAKMARQFRVGANAGGAIPNGAELNLARAAGGEEAVNYIKLQNEEMSRGTLMMFMNLGQATTGSYALGSNLIDYVLNGQEVIADWFRDTFNEYMVEDDVDWNEGEDQDPVPLLGYRRQDDRQLALQDLVALIDKGVITVDDELEAWIRESYRMPRLNPSTTPRSLPGSGSPAPAATGASGGTNA